MSNQDDFFTDQYHRVLERGHTPDETAEILLQSRLSILDACERLLDQPTDALQRLLEELDASEAAHKSQEATDSQERRPPLTVNEE
jgi:hypothetical protein